MSRHVGRVIVLATVLALPLGAPSMLHAQSWLHSWTLCTPLEAFHSCHSVSLRTDAVMAGSVRQGTLISISAHNLQGQSYAWDNTTASGLQQVTFIRPSPIGDYYNPSVPGAPSGGAHGSPTWAVWSAGYLGVGNVTADGDFRLGEPPRVIGGCSADALPYPYAGATCASNSWITFSFTIGDNVDADEFRSAYIYARGEGSQYGHEVCMSDPNQWPEGPYPACDVRGESLTQLGVVPEPVTIVLLATGLFGIGAARLRRRKKDQQIDA